jgi:hypothetical protein
MATNISAGAPNPGDEERQRRAARKIKLAQTNTPPTRIKLPKLPTFTKQQYAHDDESEPPRVRMTPEQWYYGVPRNPIQKVRRDTARKLDHLFKFCKEHATARMGIYPDGRTTKIDCHSRGRIWCEQPELVDYIPRLITVECYPVRDDEHAAERFRKVDNKKTAKNAADDVHGSFRLRGVPTDSKFFQSASNIKSPLSYAYGIVAASTLAPDARPANKQDATIDEQVNVFFDALSALDALNVNGGKMKAPFITAFLLAYTKHGDDCLPFFKRINIGNFGRKEGKKMCPVAAIERERDLYVGKSGSSSTHMELVTKILGALDNFMDAANFREENYQPKVDMQKIMKVDLSCYLLRNKAKRTGRTINKRKPNDD